MYVLIGLKPSYPPKYCIKYGLEHQCFPKYCINNDLERPYPLK